MKDRTYLHLSMVVMAASSLFSGIGTAQAEAAAATEESIRRHGTPHEGWEAKAIEAMEDLVRNGCAFYSVGHTAA